MSGTLYVVGTPIGNLSDFSPRAVETLRTVDFIAAEDTRVTLKLLNHFEIKKPMVSYHEHNLRERGNSIIDRILAGENAAVVSDAGMPCISDPGEDLVRLAAEAGIVTIVIPGPSAAVSALCLSGLSTSRFAFEGFLSTTRHNRMEHLQSLKKDTHTLIFYEAPHKLVTTLHDIRDVLGNRRLSLCRELTKKHETAFLTTIDDLLAYYKDSKPLGECVLVIQGRSRKEMEKEAQESWEEISIEDHMELYEKQGMPRKEAMKQVAKDRGVTKREIYKYLIQ